MKNKKDKFFLQMFFVLIVFVFVTPVQAADDCNGLLTVQAMEFIEEIINYIRIFVPILLIILGSVDFANAIISQDQEALKKSGSKFVKRAIAAIAVFFVPLIVKVLLSLPGIKDNINLVDDPTCGI